MKEDYINKPLKNIAIRSALFLLLVFGGRFSLYAQTNPVIDNIVQGQYSSDWQVYKSLELADIYYKYSDCSDPANGLYPEKILFRVVNKTENKIYVFWDYVLEYNNKTVNAAPDENLVQVTLEPSQSAEGSCTNIHQTKLGIFYRYKNGDDLLTGFQFNELNESKLD